MIKFHKFLNYHYLKIIKPEREIISLAIKSHFVGISLRSKILDYYTIILAYLIRPISVSFYTSMMIELYFENIDQ